MSETPIAKGETAPEGPRAQAEAPAPIKVEGSMPSSIKGPTTPLRKDNEEPATVPDKCQQSDSDGLMEDLLDLRIRDLIEAATRKVAVNGAHPATKQNVKMKRKKFLGISYANSWKTRDAYEQKYTQDLYGEEASENGRIWLTYLDEAKSFDRERVEEWKGAADVLLVFAGIFSGVITAFIGLASQGLQRDNSGVSASLLFEIAGILRAQSNGTPLNMIPASTLTPTSPFTPSTNALLVNGLWFTSLAITLSTSLFAFIAKQWSYYSLSSIAGTANERARIRQLRFKGFEEWKVDIIFEILPILLYLAVGLFLAGIIIMLFPMNAIIAWTIVGITGITYTLYLISVILPIWYPECPYTTSLTIFVGTLFFALKDIHWIEIIKQMFRRLDPRNLQIIRTLTHYALKLCRLASTVILKFNAPRHFRLASTVILKFNAPRHFRLASTVILKLFGFISSSFRLAKTLILKLFGFISSGFRLASTPVLKLFGIMRRCQKFANWREENMVQAIRTAGRLDFEALDWLYPNSWDRSVHRMIARCAAVNPTIGKRFNSPILKNINYSLEIGDTNIADLRYGLCLDLLASDPNGRRDNWVKRNHWDLLRNSPEVTESQLEEYQHYNYISNIMISDQKTPVLRRPIYDEPPKIDELKLPLAMWCFLFIDALQDATVAAYILTERMSNLLCNWDLNPTRQPMCNAGLVCFKDKALGWWKLDYLFRYFKLGNPEHHSSEAGYYGMCYQLYIAVYRNLTSDLPLIADQKKRQGLLETMFMNFRFSIKSSTESRSLEIALGFLKEICHVNSFRSESMTNLARSNAIRCLSSMEIPMDAHLDNHLTTEDDHHFSLVYQWYAQHDSEVSYITPPLFVLLLAHQNHRHLSTILLDDPDPVSLFSKCLHNFAWYRRFDEKESVYPVLTGLFDFVKLNPKHSLFIILYSPSVLVQLWRLFVYCKWDIKGYFQLMPSPPDREMLNELSAAMNKLAQSDDLAKFKSLPSDHVCRRLYRDNDDVRFALTASAYEFGQFIHNLPENVVSDKDHDTEERGRVPDPNKHTTFNSTGNWMNNTLGLKTFGQTDQ